MTLEIVTLTDPQSGHTAKILPGFGFNCYSYVGGPADATSEVLFSVPDFITGQQRPSRSGIPVLFPYPGRLRGKVLQFNGRSYPLEGDDGHGSAIHGYVLGRTWRVVEQTASRAVGQFRASQADPTLVDKWPADFELTLSYELRDGGLHAGVRVFNPDSRPLPFGLGLHPWFNLPLAPSGSRDECLIRAPVRERWLLQDRLPSGKREPTAGAYDLASGKKFADCQLDDIFTTQGSNLDRHVATIDDAAAARRLTIEFGREFDYCVVFTPPHREAICIEPYTCTPNAPELAEAGIDAGFQLLQPGQSCELWMSITLRSTANTD